MQTPLLYVLPDEQSATESGQEAASSTPASTQQQMRVQPLRELPYGVLQMLAMMSLEESLEESFRTCHNTPLSSYAGQCLPRSFLA